MWAWFGFYRLVCYWLCKHVPSFKRIVRSVVWMTPSSQDCFWIFALFFVILTIITLFPRIYYNYWCWRSQQSDSSWLSWHFLLYWVFDNKSDVDSAGSWLKLSPLMRLVTTQTGKILNIYTQTTLDLKVFDSESTWHKEPLKTETNIMQSTFFTEYLTQNVLLIHRLIELCCTGLAE